MKKDKNTTWNVSNHNFSSKANETTKKLDNVVDDINKLENSINGRKNQVGLICNMLRAPCGNVHFYFPI